MNEKSEAYRLLEIIWLNEKTGSYKRLNEIMYGCLNLAIKANLQFHEDDIKNIAKNFRGGYWFSVNGNGKGLGEVFYQQAIFYNNLSAIKSFEKWTKLKPFILNNKRLCAHFEFRDTSLKYRVTGFSEDYKKVFIIAYQITDRKEVGKKKLINLTNAEWLEFRKDKKII